MNHKPKVWRRSYHNNKHHLVNKVNGGPSIESNLLTIDSEKHKALHFIFGNLNLDEIIALLQRVKIMKDAQKRKFYL